MLAQTLRLLTAPFRLIPWYVWLAAAAVLAWLGRNILLIIATIIAFHPIPVPPIFQGEPDSIAEARAQDLRHFHHVRRNERSMDDAMKARFDAAVDALELEAADLTDAEFQLALAGIQAIIDNGHSNASATRMVQSFPRLPIRTHWMDGELRVLRALPGHERLLGAELTHIGDVPVEEAMARFRPSFGGVDAWFNSFVPLLLETPAYLAAVGIDDMTLRLRFDDGRVDAITLPAVDPVDGARRFFSADLVMPTSVETDDWLSVQPAGDPLYLSNPDHGYWFEALPDLDAVYLNLSQNLTDESGESLPDFVGRAGDEIAAIAPSVIIVDQRLNGGGDLTITRPLMVRLGDIVGPDGRVYLLTSGGTFSAGIVNLAMAKEAAPEQTRLVGEPIGDRLQFWAEGWWYSLPNSGFRARYSTGYYDLQNGCEGAFICPWGSLHIFPVIVDDLDIDIPAPMSWEAYVAGRDPAMEAIRTIEQGGE
ncbi:hypothetical protein [Maricaulis sp.]|uniref:hypothetical protein n=1 Tax=Maricaulis sp. TaxID=1486257 RepID=UPI002620F276|nr:hypothetical protein [Maricaulis sp.]MDF1768275.1 hypothetical protein [Maricaulis sp.]